MLISRILTILILLIFTLQCGNKSNVNNSVSRKDLKEPLIQENIKIKNEEIRMIDRYMERHEWEMEITGTGLRYMIYENGFGIKAEESMVATVEYEIKLMDGTICYSSIEKGPRKFLIGKDNVESGIDEGVTLLHVGDRAKFIIPNYLAHGLSGDNKRIPPMSTLIVDLHLLRLD